jgi:hypothetical protein
MFYPIALWRGKFSCTPYKAMAGPAAKYRALHQKFKVMLFY